MNHSAAWKLLPAYLDGELSATRGAALEVHLQDCSRCRDELAALRTLQQRAAALPLAIEPSHDLWPEIAAALETAAAHPRKPPLRWPANATQRLRLAREALRGSRQLRLGLAAGGILAATLLVVVTEIHRPPAGIPAELSDETGGAGGAGAAASSPEDGLLAALEAECSEGDERFVRLAAESGAGSTRSVFEIFQANLFIINQAIDEARDAWRANPQSPHLVRMLVAAYQAKSALQSQASRLAATI